MLMIVDRHGKPGLGGDIITEVAGSNVSGAGLVHVRRALKDEHGKNIHMKIQRKNKVLEINFQLVQGFDFIEY